MASEEPPTQIHFGGIARLFPLPNVVLFPYVTQPLHIFEQRYRQMTADALAGDRLLALALLAQGWEKDYEGRPALHPIVCLGRIMSEERLEDGRYHLQLRGMIRARILHEVDDGKLYRSARLELLNDGDLPTPSAEKGYRSGLRDLLPAWCKGQEGALDLLRRLLDSQLSLGAVCDIISYALPLKLDLKQQLLSMPQVNQRAHLLLTSLRHHGDSQHTPHVFPPDFSTN